jgi:hypothetical protein
MTLRGGKMPYTATLEKKITQISEQYQQDLLEFVDYLLYKQNEKKEATVKNQKKIDSLNSIFGMLTPEESKAVEDSISEGIKIRAVQ